MRTRKWSTKMSIKICSTKSYPATSKQIMTMNNRFHKLVQTYKRVIMKMIIILTTLFLVKVAKRKK